MSRGNFFAMPAKAWEMRVGLIRSRHGEKATDGGAFGIRLNPSFFLFFHQPSRPTVGMAY